MPCGNKGAHVEKKGIAFVAQPVQRIDAEHNALDLNDGSRLDYDYLVITTGPKLSFDELPGSGPAGYTHLPKKIKKTSPLFSGEGAGVW